MERHYEAADFKQITFVSWHELIGGAHRTWIGLLSAWFYTDTRKQGE